MVITYFNYLWDIEGISAGSAIKAKELISTINNLGHIAHLVWRTPQPNRELSKSYEFREIFKPKFKKYLFEPKRIISNFANLPTEYRILKKHEPDILFNRLELFTFSSTWLSIWI